MVLRGRHGNITQTKLRTVFLCGLLALHHRELAVPVFAYTLQAFEAFWLFALAVTAACNPNLGNWFLCQLGLEFSAGEQLTRLCKIYSWQAKTEQSNKESVKRFWKLQVALSVILVDGQGNGTFTHLVELNPLFSPLGARVWHPQSPKLCSEEVGRVSLHGRDVEAENLWGDAFWTVDQIVWNRENWRGIFEREHAGLTSSWNTSGACLSKALICTFWIKWSHKSLRCNLEGKWKFSHQTLWHDNKTKEVGVRRVCGTDVVTL